MPFPPISPLRRQRRRGAEPQNETNAPRAAGAAPNVPQLPKSSPQRARGDADRRRRPLFAPFPRQPAPPLARACITRRLPRGVASARCYHRASAFVDRFCARRPERSRAAPRARHDPSRSYVGLTCKVAVRPPTCPGSSGAAARGSAGTLARPAPVPHPSRTRPATGLARETTPAMNGARPTRPFVAWNASCASETRRVPPRRHAHRPSRANSGRPPRAALSSSATSSPARDARRDDACQRATPIGLSHGAC